ncbi:DNA glycosylase [Westerdykella ornata]|uniref:DNA glycosylase n=1 Tax=Westerdykella ornata TaxID=318751 RepID=A0A6A6JN29_WESOR|nr:DNA glycosylase [Westerdykella ornata]KAF2277644.1 DNA glycosylase [Westerdykella ornata]
MERRVTRSATKLASPEKPPFKPKEPVQVSSPPKTAKPPKIRKRKSTAVQNGNSFGWPVKKSRALSRNVGKLETPQTNIERGVKYEELPHNLGLMPVFVPPASVVGQSVSVQVKPSNSERDASQGRVPKKNKKLKYPHGVTPYPDWPHPTPEECREVNRLLTSLHGEYKPPAAIPPPSLTVAGCGEVPSVLDAMIRTLLSASTTQANAARAFQGLVEKFGILQEGIGKGSVNWNKVHLASQVEVRDAIKNGGLANSKSKHIKRILQMVWEENQERRKIISSDGSVDGLKGLDVTKTAQHVLSLDHYHLLDTNDALDALMSYPGIAYKTALCVALFCLRRPAFAVDTHVFRIAKWLGWVPPAGEWDGLAPGKTGKFAGPDRDSTAAHLQVRVPDDLKYSLHQLLFKHGQLCRRCQAITGEHSEGWDKGCVIDHLVKREKPALARMKVVDRNVTLGSLTQLPSTSTGSGRAPRKEEVIAEEDMEAGEESSGLNELDSDEDFED